LGRSAGLGYWACWACADAANAKIPQALAASMILQEPACRILDPPHLDQILAGRME
jgi:hypothetical protein